MCPKNHPDFFSNVYHGYLLNVTFKINCVCLYNPDVLIPTYNVASVNLMKYQVDYYIFIILHRSQVEKHEMIDELFIMMNFGSRIHVFISLWSNVESLKAGGTEGNRT